MITFNYKYFEEYISHFSHFFHPLPSNPSKMGGLSFNGPRGASYPPIFPRETCEESQLSIMVGLMCGSSK